MQKAKCDIRIATSGWHYDHWRGLFYPAKLPKSKWFEYYARDFNTVEVNNTFYQLPKQETFENWRKQAPKNFIFTVKANRYITHIKRLKGASVEVARFFERVRLLKETLGPVLYQLPPNMPKDLELLTSFIKLLPKNHIAVFEFRHDSWYSEDTYNLLKNSNVSFCVHDMPGRESPRIITGDIIYVRFHGTTGRYEGNYPKATLKNWAEWIKDNSKPTRAVYAYFNNDYNAYAVGNAKTLRGKLLSR